MQRVTIGGITAVALAVVLVTGCADESGQDAVCVGQSVVFVDDDGDGEGTYHCGSAQGSQINELDIDIDVKRSAKSSPGKPVSVPKAPAAKPPAPNLNKPAAPAPKAPAPAPKAGK